MYMGRKCLKNWLCELLTYSIDLVRKSYWCLKKRWITSGISHEALNLREGEFFTWDRLMSRALSRAALPLCRAIDKRGKRCLISMSGDLPHWRASWVAILRKEVATGSSKGFDDKWLEKNALRPAPCARRFFAAFLASIAVEAVSAANVHYTLFFI